MSRRLPAVVLGSLVVAACSIQRMQPPPAKSQQFAMDDHMAHMSAADLRAPSISLGNSSSVQQDRPGLPPSANTAPARLKATPRHAEWVKIAWEAGSKDSIMAWVVYPSTKTKAPVVVVVHEIFGLSTWVRGVADQVAADGFIAIAPDFLSKVRGGPTTDEMPADSARKIIGGVTDADKIKIINAAASYGMTQPSAVQKYAVIGYCWGGAATFTNSIAGGVKGYSGGVAFYGLPIMSRAQPATATTAAVPGTFVVDSLKKISTPIMLLSGSKDARITAAMPALDSMMKALGKNYAGTNYEGAIHGFLRAQDDAKAPSKNPDEALQAKEEAANRTEEAANLAATKDGWPKTIAFLKKNLGVK